MSLGTQPISAESVPQPHKSNIVTRTGGGLSLLQQRMPFHMTVLGVYLGNEFSPASRDRMEIFGEAICEKVSKVSDLNLETSIVQL